MSLINELLKAIQVQDLPRINCLLDSHPEFNINYNEGIFLTEAIKQQSNEVLDCLIKRIGIQLDNKKGFTLIMRKTKFSSHTILGLIHDSFISRISSFSYRSLLRNTEDIDGISLRKYRLISDDRSDDRSWEVKSVVTIPKFFSQLSNAQKKLPLQFYFYFSEVILRHSKLLIDQVVELNIKTNHDHFKVDALIKNFENYLMGTEIPIVLCEQARRSFVYLQKLGIINSQEEEQLEKVLQKASLVPCQVYFKLPDSLKKECKPLKNSRDLYELFAELQSLLYPLECLPSLPWNHNFFHLEAYDKSLESIQSWQNPANLHQLLEISAMDFNRLLSLSKKARGESQAAIVLAQLLIYYADEEIIVDKDGEETRLPLFTKEQKQRCLDLFHQFYACPDQEFNHLETLNELAGLRWQNQELQKQIQDLRGELRATQKEMIDANRSTQEKLDQIHALLCKRVEPDEIEKKKTGFNPSFYSG